MTGTSLTKCRYLKRYVSTAKNMIFDELKQGISNNLFMKIYNLNLTVHSKNVL